MLPSHKDLRDLLEATTGRAVAVSSGDVYAPSPYDRATFGVYVDRQVRTRAVLVLDLRLTVLAGAAMGMFPAGRARAELEKRALVPGTRQLVEELFAGFTLLLGDPDAAAVRLYQTYSAGADLPTDLPAYMHMVGHRMDLRVDIAGYGTGRLSLVCPPVIPRPRRGESSRQTAEVR